MSAIKQTLKEFDLRLWKNGEEVKRRDGGKPDEIFYFKSFDDINDQYPIYYSYQGTLFTTTKLGYTKNSDQPSDDDLVIVPKIIRIWVAIPIELKNNVRKSFIFRCSNSAEELYEDLYNLLDIETPSGEEDIVEAQLKVDEHFIIRKTEINI